MGCLDVWGIRGWGVVLWVQYFLLRLRDPQHLIERILVGIGGVLGSHQELKKGFLEMLVVHGVEIQGFAGSVQVVESFKFIRLSYLHYYYNHCHYSSPFSPNNPLPLTLPSHQQKSAIKPLNSPSVSYHIFSRRKGASKPLSPRVSLWGQSATTPS